MQDLLGGKGAGLAEMTNAGIPVPPGFTITTEVCKLYYDSGMTVPKEIDAEMKVYMARLEAATGKKFGDPANPLLVSVRSGAKFSMPGMMDTILNLGLNEETVKGLAKKTSNERFALDNYRRFIQMFGNVVLGIDKDMFEEDHHQEEEGQAHPAGQFASAGRPEGHHQEIQGHRQAQDRRIVPGRSLACSFAWPATPSSAVGTTRARSAYRRLNNIPANLGTAVNVQTMVFGNMGNDSATGVGFTRNPATGEKEFYGEYLVNAQGEDVVAGIRTPQPIAELKDEMPKVYKQLREITDRLEKHYRDIQDFEFTIEEGQLYMLQTRTGKRTVQAAIKIAVDMVKEKLITKEEALMRIEPSQLDQLLHPRLDPKAKYEVVATGLAASPGAASGHVVFTAEDAVQACGNKQRPFSFAQETNPDDIEGMNVAVGILTSRGGMTSHAAVVARGMGKCCVTGAEALRVNAAKKTVPGRELIIKEGEVITLNGSTGEVILGEVATIEPELSGEFAELMKWADETRTLGVRTNADIPRDARQAVQFGAEGIGLCRTEHMFFAEDRIPIVQEMILADTSEERQEALDKLLPFQKKGFQGTVRGHGRTAGDHSDARSAAARIPAQDVKRSSRRSPLLTTRPMTTRRVWRPSKRLCSGSTN